MTVLRLALVAAIAVGLAACGSGRPKAPPQQASQSQQTAKIEKSEPRGQAAIAPARPQEPVNDDPQQFMGLDQPGVTAIIGKPAMIRRDGPAEVWQYRGQGCVFDIFMYRKEDDGFEVKYVDLRAPDLAEDRQRACLANIIRSNRPATS